MKIISAIIIFLIMGTLTVSGQWSTTDNNIFNTNTGNVGIGVSTPIAKLQIEAPPSDNDETVFKLGHRSNTSQVGTIMEIGTSGYSTAGVSRIVGYSNPSATTFSKLALQTWNGSSWNNLLMDGLGNVGIGTTNPTEKLTIGQAISGYKSMLSLNELTNNGSNSMGIDFKFGGLSGFPWGSTGRIEVARQLTTANFDMIFHTATAGVLSEKVRIMNSGNVGIGTTLPGAKLDVNGTTYSRKVFVGVPDANTIANMGTNNLLAVNGTAVFVKAKVAIYGTTWPDYVFSPTYQLTSLDSLEQFIKLNGHLPEVPIAKEVDKNGIDLGDNQVLLLKKVEQLTLYIIGLKNKIDTKDKRIQQLESMNSRINLIEEEIKKMKQVK